MKAFNLHTNLGQLKEIYTLPPKLLNQIYTLIRNNWAILYTSRRRL